MKEMGLGGDLVALWEVRLSDGVHKVGFEHGTTTGRRVLWVDGEERMRHDWMFKLVGSEVFDIGDTKCVIKIEPVGGFSYEYSLEVNGKSYKKFTENQSKILKTWVVPVEDSFMRIVLERDTLDVWVNGKKLETAGEFVDDGTETHFDLAGHPAYIKAVSSGNRREGIIHSLVVDDTEIPEAVE
ncbi:fas apoptotic inhibitory molecule 1 [Macrobrachium rosenbergii]|uniref:fas apoptotic inhibitory molecule 1 n=1 Tax=Macrobrachium rosenbergii TaxID=79674 RepID=UPI0034D5FCC8